MTVVAVALAREPPLWHCGLHGERRKQREEAGCLGLLLVVVIRRLCLVFVVAAPGLMQSWPAQPWV